MLSGCRGLAVLLLAVVSGCSVQSSPKVAGVVAEPDAEAEHRVLNISRAEEICQQALLRGVDFRATGNEPDWLLEISDGDSVLLVLNYGADRYRFDAATLSTQTPVKLPHEPLQQDDHRLSVTLEHRPCQDSMSGVLFPTQVELEFDGKPLLGCGKALRSAPPSETPPNYR